MRIKCIGNEGVVSFFETDENSINLPVPVVASKQIHKDEIYFVHEIPREDVMLEGYDAFITDIKGVCLMTSHADCIPVQIYDPGKGVIAAVHAGWRGTAMNIAGKAVSAMRTVYGCENMIGYIGSGISRCCFEVGPEVMEAFSEYPEALIGSDHVDLKLVNRIQMERAGVREIEVSPYCTCCDNRFLSYRRDNTTVKRMKSGIYMPL